MGVEIEILRHDGGLARAVPAAERAGAAAKLRAASCRLPMGPWDAPVGHHTGTLGLLVLDGFLLREVSLAGGTSAELTGPGDVLRPWDDETVEAPLPAEPSWTALTPVTLALLDRDFIQQAATWPDLLVEVGSRLIHRARCQSALLAISHIPRLDPRLLALLWHVADRFGHVEDGGVVMPLRLTHETIGCLVGARRPSVSRSLHRVASSGWIAPRPAGGWWLVGEAGAAIEACGNPGYRRRAESPAAGTAAST